MKRLLILRSGEQETTIRDILMLHDIEFSQSESSFIDEASFWVKDDDYSKAKELVEAYIALNGKKMQIQFQGEWRDRWGSSYARWFLGSIKGNPKRIFRLFLVAFLLTIFLLYPIWTLLK